MTVNFSNFFLPTSRYIREWSPLQGTFSVILCALAKAFFFDIRRGMRVEVCPLVGERKPWLKPWPPVSHLLAPGEKRCLPEWAVQAIRQSSWQGRLLVVTSYLPLDELQVYCANRAQQQLFGIPGSSGSQSLPDSSSLRAQSPCLIGTVMSGLFRRVVWDPRLLDLIPQSVPGTGFSRPFRCSDLRPSTLGGNP